MAYQFKLDIFEGPLDLLLHLIREQKMDVYDIPISQVTQQYLKYIDMMQDLNLELAGEYLLMAAELTRIKSKVLLPDPKTDEDGEEGEDPRLALARRLLEYKRFKNAAFELRQKEHDRQQMFSRQGELVFDDEPEEAMVSASVFELFSAFKKVLEQKTFRQDYEVKITTLSVAERLPIVLEILNSNESVTFDVLFEHVNTKQELIVTFLAILELIRMKLIRVQQTDSFETIRLIVTSDIETQESMLTGFQDEEAPTGSFPDPIADSSGNPE